jgi:zinc transporter, ZIP family
VSTSQTIVLGAIAGFTIYLGLPLGRVQVGNLRAKAFLNAASAGILLFLLVEILGHATEPVEDAVKEAAGGEAGWLQSAGLGLIYAVGLGVGLLSLLYLGRLWRRPSPPRPAGVGPGAMSVAEAGLSRSDAQSAALRTGMAIAAGIGLHNFSEGLAIGQAASGGELTLAVLLIVGFALHNTTEGFGIVGPLAAAEVRAPWGWLALAGLIGGGPTMLGTIVGTSFSSIYLYVGCLALAAGALAYVIGELLPLGRRLSWELTLWGLLAGFLLGVATELVLAVAGG